MAFDLEKSLVTVPDAIYHYYSNPTSTVKQKLDTKKENDKISTSLQRIRYAKEHGIYLNNPLIIKEDHFLWAIKHYFDRKDYYLLGLKVFSKKIPYNNMKTFIVFIPDSFNDVQSCNSLCRNIKDIFPESKIILITGKNYSDYAEYLEYIDEVVMYNAEMKSKGICGFFRFIKEFKYKNIYASLILHNSPKKYFISKLLRSKNVLMYKDNINNGAVKNRYNRLIEPLTNKKIKNYFIEYDLPKNTIPDRTDENIINICLSCDENYAKYAGVVMASILANAKINDKIAFYILDGNISQKTKEKLISLKSIKDCFINFVNIKEEEFEDYKKIQTHRYISIAACYRLKLASLLPDVDKIIYLDCDTVVCSSLRELFNIDLKDKVLGGVSDIDSEFKSSDFSYINSGVLLMDLDKIRTQNIENEFLLYARENINNIKLGDQEIINKVLKNRILKLSEKFNVQSECFIRRSSFTKNPVIVHFIGTKKPWQHISWSVHKNMYFKYLQLTPWKLENRPGLLNEFHSFISWFKHRPFFCFQLKFWNAVKKDFYTNDKPKIFAAVLMACFGDVILCNALFQNIKRLYPDSKIIFIVDKPWVDAAKYQKDVDEVIVFDKRNQNKGFFGLLKFIMHFPYRNIDCIFTIYDNFRADIISLLLRPKKIAGKPYDYNVSVQERHCNLLKKITKEKIINCPIVYNADNNIPDKIQGFIFKNKKYIALCTTSKLKIKDMPLLTAIELIEKLNADGYEVLFVGNGEKAKKYSEELLNNNCKIINLVNKTTIYELAQVLRNCKALISVDTGTMHFAYANKVPTVCVFYKKANIKIWAPDKNLYPYTNVPDENSVEQIYASLKNVIRGLDE